MVNFKHSGAIFVIVPKIYILTGEISWTQVPYVIIFLIILLFFSAFSSTRDGSTTVNKIRMRTFADDGNNAPEQITSYYRRPQDAQCDLNRQQHR